MDPSQQRLASGVRVGRYEIIELLGEGAMGTVYRARDPLIDRVVALKILHGRRANDPSGETDRFLREAQAAGQLDHPHIVRVHDCGSDSNGELTYIVMEYLAGPSLEKVLESHALAPSAVVDLLGQLSSAIDAAHAVGMVHRDIKPANILFTEDGNTAKLADFGVARRVDSSVTQDLSRMATPLYMAPEQAQGKPVNARTDIFALGVLSYQLLSGRRPFSGSDPLALSYQVVHETPPRITEVAPELPATLDSVFECALSKDPGTRFETAEQFLHALQSALGGTPMPIRPPAPETQIVEPLRPPVSSPPPTITRRPSPPPAAELREARAAEPPAPRRTRMIFVWGGVLTALIAGLIVGGSGRSVVSRGSATPTGTPVAPSSTPTAPRPEPEPAPIATHEADPPVLPIAAVPPAPAPRKPTSAPKRETKPQPSASSSPRPSELPATVPPSLPATVQAAPAPPPEPVVRPAPTGTLSLSLRYRIQSGVLTVELDGRKILEENFEKRTPGLAKIAEFEPTHLKAGPHRLTAHVVGGRGKEYHSEPYDMEVEAGKEIALRIRIDDGALEIAPAD